MVTPENGSIHVYDVLKNLSIDSAANLSPTYILPTRLLRFLYSKTYLGARYAGPLFNIQYSAVHDSVQVGVDKLGSNLCTSTSYTNSDGLSKGNIILVDETPRIWG